MPASHRSASRRRSTRPSDPGRRHGVVAERLNPSRGPGRRGVLLLDELVRDSGGHSPLERRFLGLVREAGLPRPRTQVVPRRDGRTFARVDFLFEPQGVVVEVSGRHGHASDAERARDAPRRNELQDVGRVVYECTSREVFEEAERVVVSLRVRLGSRSGLDASP